MRMSEDNITRELATLTATVAGLKEQWQRQDAAATLGRRELYRRFDELKFKVIETTHKVDNAMADIAMMKPAIELFKNGQQQIVGASRVMRVLWAMAVGIAGMIGWAIHELWRGSPPPHP